MNNLMKVFLLSIVSLALFAEDEMMTPLPTVTLPSTQLEPIRLNSLNISTKITGNIAQTTYEMGFYNPNSRVLEGELKMPLLDGQSVVGYALEMNGVFRDAVVVNKAKAKESFENTIRQQIDPAIMEKTLGNNYKLRLYPIPNKGIKKLKVTVEELLSSKDGFYKYVVPFVSTTEIAHFSLDLKVVSAQKPEVHGFIEDEEMQVNSSGYYLEYKKKNIELDKSIKLLIPKASKGNDYFQTSNDSDNWFMSVVEKKSSLSISRVLPKQIEIIWDSSLSMVNRNLTKELAFLEMVFLKLPTCRVSLKRLDINLHDEGTYEIVNGDWHKLKEKLKTIQLNGAKDLSKLRVNQSADEVFLFSNGVNTFSDKVAVALSNNVISVNSSIVADHNNLKYISNKYINLLALSVDEAFQKYVSKSKTEVTETSKNLSDIYIKDLGESFLILGRVNGEKGKLTFTSSLNEYVVNINTKKESKLLARVWAKEKINQLSLRYNNNKTQINNLAKKYTIMTKDSSLIVLDRVEDYVRYKIVPPKALQSEYEKLVERQDKMSSNKKEQAIQESISLLDKQLIWYEKDFLAIAEAKRLAALKRKEEARKREEARELERAGDSDMFGGDINPVMVFEQEEVVVPVSPSPVPAPSLARAPSLAKNKVSTRMPNVKKQIKLKEWTPNAPYIKAIKSVSSEEQMKKYYSLQEEYVRSIPFYLDMADFFYKKGEKEEALLILSNILELDFEKSEFMRVFAFKLLELKFEKVAVWFFERIEALRPFEAQASRDLALVYEKVGRYQEALAKHYSILTKVWDGRFQGSKIVTINEMNHLIFTQNVDTKGINKRLVADMPVGMRIVINWSTDNSDMDLWVIDPNNEKTYYAHRESTIGGKISNDMTRGYGPEEFMIKKAIRGNYKIKVKYFASSAQKIMGETVIRAEIYTDYVSGNENQKEIVFRVKEAKDVIDIGEIVY